MSCKLKLISQFHEGVQYWHVAFLGSTTPVWPIIKRCADNLGIYSHYRNKPDSVGKAFCYLSLETAIQFEADLKAAWTEEVKSESFGVQVAVPETPNTPLLKNAQWQQESLSIGEALKECKKQSMKSLIWSADEVDNHFLNFMAANFNRDWHFKTALDVAFARPASVKRYMKPKELIAASVWLKLMEAHILMYECGVDHHSVD